MSFLTILHIFFLKIHVFFITILHGSFSDINYGRNYRKKRRNYDQSTLNLALKMINEDRKTLYAASKATGVPWSTLKLYSEKTESDQNLQKLGRPFALNPEMEVKLFKYIIQMQEIGFGLIVYQIRVLAFKLATSNGRDKYFLQKAEIASQKWWEAFKERYNLTLRVAENLSAYRASMANPSLIADFYSKYKALLTKLDLFDKPGQIWNCDETGLNFVANKGNFSSNNHIYIHSIHTHYSYIFF